MKQKVVHLTSETRRRVLRLYHALDDLLSQDDSSTGLDSRYGFCFVRPTLYRMYTHLWGKDDPSLTKEVYVEFPDSSSPRVKHHVSSPAVNVDDLLFCHDFR